jgi:hypothetical protein
MTTPSGDSLISNLPAAGTMNGTEQFIMDQTVAGQTNTVTINSQVLGSQLINIPSALPFTVNNIKVLGGTIDNTTIGATTPSTGVFTALTDNSLTANSFLYSGTGSLLSTTTAPTNGQLLIGSTGVAPVAAALTGTSNEIIVTNGAGSITLSTPQAIGTGSSVTFATVTASNALTSGNTLSLSATSNTSVGAQIELTGNGATTPNKFIRVLSGNFQIVNSAGSSNILTLTDAGDLTVPNIDNTIIGATTAAAGSFTTVTASSTIQGALLSSTGNIQGPATGYSIVTATGLSSGGGIQIFDGSNGNKVNITNAGAAVAVFTSTGINSAAIGATTPSTGAFTTLNASGNDALLYTTTNGQVITSGSGNQVTTWTKTFDRNNTNFATSTGTFTAPATGYYNVSAQITFASHVGVVNAQYALSIIGNGANLVTGSVFQQSTSTDLVSVTASCVASLSSGQTIVLQAFQNTGSSVALSTTTALNYVSINRIP